MTDRFENRLSEFLDGELTSEERSLVERHLAECAACAETLVALREVRARARDLQAREPKADLWPGIAARISGTAATAIARPGGGRALRRISFSIPQLAAAAVTLASLSAGLAWLAGSGAGATGDGSIVATAPASPPIGDPDVTMAATGAESLATAEYYAASIRALEEMLFEREQPLPPETEARIRRALLTIDRAIEDARAALEAVPDDPYLRKHVTRTMRRKSDFLREAVRMAAQS